MVRLRLSSLLSAAMVCLAVSVAPLDSAADPSPQDDLKRLSIEELMRIDVTTAARRAEPVGTTAVSISVLTADDIRRAGVTTIADALALADGVHVARVSAGAWRISARGFNGSTPNKLLVMVDGRTVNSSLFTGTFWNVLDYVLADIDRIEVIRGPGTPLWGANAVNGVVNIITRHSADSQGGYVAMSSGGEDPAIVEARYGGMGAGTAWRAYGKFASRDNQITAAGAAAGDWRRREQIGVRIDGGERAGASWMLKADAFHSQDSFVRRFDGEYTELALQGRWSRPLSPVSRVDLQSYYQREFRRAPNQLTHHIDLVDIDAQHTIAVGARHAVVWGGGWRLSADETHGSAAIGFDPANRTYALWSAFAQDEIEVVPRRLFATVGAKYEHNAFSGGEVQPNVRARLMLPASGMLWGSVARAIRRPTRLDEDVRVPGPFGTVLISGSDDFQPESLVATEVGYRMQPAPQMSFDVTVFRHEYDDLRSQEAPLVPLAPIVFANSLEGQSRGVETSVTVQPVDWWRTHAGYTWFDVEISRTPGSRDFTNGAAESNDPNHLFRLRTSVDVGRRVEIDAMLRSTGELPNPRVPGFTTLDLRFGWRATPQVDLSIIGHDLLDDSHPEAGPALPSRIEIQRAVRAAATITF